MSKQKYEQVQVLLPEIRAMAAADKTQQEITEHFDLSNKYMVKRLLHRERGKEEKIAQCCTCQRNILHNSKVHVPDCCIWIGNMGDSDSHASELPIIPMAPTEGQGLSGCGALAAFFFMISQQPYASSFAFLILVIKAFMLIKWA